MSAASKLTALVVGTAGTLTVSGALLFGAMVDGIVGPVSESQRSSRRRSQAMATSRLLCSRRPTRQRPGGHSRARGAKEAEAPSELKEDLPALAEKDLDATTKVEEKDEPATVDPVPLAEDDAKDEPKRRNARRGQSRRSRGRRPSCSPDGPASWLRTAAERERPSHLHGTGRRGDI